MKLSESLVKYAEWWHDPLNEICWNSMASSHILKNTDLFKSSRYNLEHTVWFCLLESEFQKDIEYESEMNPYYDIA